jgi:hypothetical protein
MTYILQGAEVPDCGEEITVREESCTFVVLEHQPRRSTTRSELDVFSPIRQTGSITPTTTFTASAAFAAPLVGRAFQARRRKTGPLVPQRDHRIETQRGDAGTIAASVAAPAIQPRSTPNVIGSIGLTPKSSARMS